MLNAFVFMSIISCVYLCISVIYSENRITLTKQLIIFFHHYPDLFRKLGQIHEKIKIILLNQTEYRTNLK